MLRAKAIRIEETASRGISPFPATESTVDAVGRQLGIPCMPKAKMAAHPSRNYPSGYEDLLSGEMYSRSVWTRPRTQHA